MKSSRSVPNAGVVPVLNYPDVRAAVAWLSTAFGFIERVKIGEDHRSQLSFGDGALIIGDVSGDRRAAQPDETSHGVLVRVEDAEAHCARAREHGAQITTEPKDFPYGERQYSATDPWGHRWTFSESRRDVAPEEWGGETVNGGWGSA